MGPNFTPLSIPPPPTPPNRPKRSLNGKAFALLSGLILFVGVISGYLALSSGLLYRSKASTGFSPVDRRGYEHCYQPFQTKTDGADITITSGSGCNSLPPISIDVWKINKSNIDDQTFVWHQEFTMHTGSNHLSIPLSIYSCSDYYQIDTWFGTGTPPVNATYEYALITATFVKPTNTQDYGPIPMPYRDGTTVNGPSSCGVNTPTPPPTATPTPKVPTSTPVPTATPTPNPKCASTCRTDSQCPADMKCYTGALGTHSSPPNHCVLAKCLVAGTVCSADKCVVIAPTTTPTPKPSSTPPPTATLSCPKPNKVKNLHINCPICKG